LEHMNSLTVLTASRCLLGKEIREDPTVGKEFASLYHDLEGGLNPLAFFFPYAPIPAHRRRDAARIEVRKLFSKVIKQRRSLQADGEEKPEDMLQILMESQYKNGEMLTDDMIAGMLVGVLFAGQHTSGITSTWTGFYLTKHPEYLAELIAEQKAIIAEFGDEVSFESLRKSVQLENCVREALRLFPPLIILMRKIKQPLKYKDLDLPVGDLLCVSPAFASRLPDVFSNPDTYDPHRFDRGEHLKAPFSYLSFGGGRHGCPGENFGILQIKTIWTVLLRTYDLQSASKDLPSPDYTNLVVGPTQPCNMRFTKRKAPIA